MNYAYIQLHAPEPPQQREQDKRSNENPYPDYEQSFIIEDEDRSQREDSHVVVIEL
jgi:hypothetical protein